MDTRKICLEGTRNEILSEITTWINNTEDNTRIFWLHGNAGTGKSSIAHTIAYRFKKFGRLGSCYCFDRNEMAEQRDKNIFTTIARDLADRDKQMRRELVAAVHLDTSLKNTTDILQQWKELIMKPAQTLSEAMVGPIVIVIDALDESGGADSRQHILRILSGKLDDDESRISKLPPNFRILLTSRPLPDIYDALNGVIHVQRKSMDSIPSALTQFDILHYVSYELSGLKGIQSKEVSTSLARASDGLFEWARLACAYIKGDDDAGITAMERFELVITRNKDDYVPLLDSMYKLTLETIFPPDQHMRRNRSIRLDRFRSVMAQILGTAEPLPLASLNNMRHQFVHARKTDIINTIIRPMGALLSGTTDPAAPIRPLHASFPEFLMDENRSGEFFIDVSHIHNDLAFASLGVMKDGLQFNICRLPTSYLPNSEVLDLDERVKKYISPELSYSCRFWTHHIQHTQFNLPLAEAVRGFFNDEWLLFWLEVSLLKTINTCASWLSNVLQWVSVCATAFFFQHHKGSEYSEMYYWQPHAGCKDISDDIADTQRFVRMFGGTISFSTPHLYLSALPFSPKYSHISQKFADRFCNVLQVVRGHSMTWPVLQGVLHGHYNTVSSVMFSPDGKCIVSGSSDQTIGLWDAETGELLRPPLKGHEDAVLCVVFSPDGKRILSGSHDQTIRLWDAETGELLLPPLHAHEDGVSSVAFSPDGKCIVSGSDDKTICLWNSETGELLQPPLKGHEGWVSSVAFSPDGKFIVSGSQDMTIRLWDAKTGKLLQPPLEGHMGQVLSVAFSTDGKHIVSGSHDQTIRLWNVKTGELLRLLEGHEGQVASVAFSPDGKCVVSGSNDKTIRLWDVETGKLLRPPLEGHEVYVVTVAFSPDGKRIVSGSDDRTIRLWDAEIVEVVQLPPKGHEGQVLSIAVSPDSKYIVSGSRDKTIRLWDAATGELLQLLEGHEGWVLSVAFSPNGKHIVSGSRDKTIRLWNAETGELLQPPLEGHEGLVRSVAFSLDGKCIVSGSDDTTVRLWDRDCNGYSNPCGYQPGYT
jgi:WD40 repeat protein